jgi:hypothetical protein
VRLSRLENPISFRRMAIVFVAAFAIWLAGTAVARADCMTAKDCLTASEWQTAIAEDYENKAAWFRATSKQNFINSYQWSQKAIFAFHAGDGTAAVWYKAIADDYASKSVADAKAADQYAAQAVFYRAGAQNSTDRGMFIMTANASAGCPLQTADAGSQQDIIACTAGAPHHSPCKTQRHPHDPSWGTLCDSEYFAICDADKDGHRTYIEYDSVYSTNENVHQKTQYDSYGRTAGKFCTHEHPSDSLFGIQRFRVCVENERGVNDPQTGKATDCSAWKYWVDS